MDVTSLYQALILDHYRQPRNFGTLPKPCKQAKGSNPVCGDDVTVYIQIESNDIKDIRFEGKGCAISIASASLMTELLKHKSLPEAESLLHQFHDMVVNQAPPQPELEKLVVLSNVRNFPMRVKCATLPWHTFSAALHQTPGMISTE
jgi:nitrogen fixation protein NifU and related proteins